MLAMLIAASFSSCGVERQDVKTLRDRGARKLEAPKVATVEQLVMLRSPRWWRWAPRHRIERAVVQVDIELLAFRNESDGDIHAIIRGGRGFLMIAEFPAVFCTGGSPYAQQMQQARQRFLQM